MWLYVLPSRKDNLKMLNRIYLYATNLTLCNAFCAAASTSHTNMAVYIEILNVVLYMRFQFAYMQGQVLHVKFHLTFI